MAAERPTQTQAWRALHWMRTRCEMDSACTSCGCAGLGIVELDPCLPVFLCVPGCRAEARESVASNTSHFKARPALMPLMPRKEDFLRSAGNQNLGTCKPANLGSDEKPSPGPFCIGSFGVSGISVPALSILQAHCIALPLCIGMKHESHERGAPFCPGLKGSPQTRASRSKVLPGSFFNPADQLPTGLKRKLASWQAGNMQVICRSWP